MKYARIMQAFFSTAWAIQLDKLQAMVEFLDSKLAHAQGIDAMGVEIEAASQQSITIAGNGVAIIPVVGVMSQRMNMFTEFSGGVSTQLLQQRIREAVSNSSVKSILLDIDSPGGSVYGLQELVSIVNEAKQSKPVVASANSLAASAAYWLAAAATEISLTPGGEVGSIGVIAMHVDWSKYNEAVGVKPTYIYSGKYKAEGNPHEPLSDDTKEYLQGQLDTYYKAFVSGVAEGRGVDKAKVLSDFGQGRTLLAKQALAAGMVDRIETFDQTLDRMQRRTPSIKNRARSELELIERQ